MLHLLLNHPDHEGRIRASDCGPLADRLEEVSARLPGEEDLRATKRFIDGLRLAATRGEDVEFR